MARKHLQQFCTQAQQWERKWCSGWQPASRGGRNRAVPLSIGLVQRSVGRSYPASVPLESALDPEAFIMKQHVWELRHHLTLEGAGLTRTLSPAPWLCWGGDCPPSCWHPGPLGESHLPKRTENSSRARTKLCIAASTDSSTEKTTAGQTHVCWTRPCSGPSHCQVGE